MTADFVSHPISDDALAQVFTENRTTYNWLDKDVPDDVLAAAWDLAKWGPTAMNCQPLRVRVVRSAADRDRLRPLMQGGNQQAIDNAPVQLILGWSPTFFENMPQFFPAVPDMGNTLHANPDMAEAWGNNNAWLQAGYLLMALRAKGLAVGPMNGADVKSIDQEFFKKCGCHAFMIVNVGYPANPVNPYPRNPRVSWAEASGCGAK